MNEDQLPVSFFTVWVPGRFDAVQAEAIRLKLATQGATSVEPGLLVQISSHGASKSEAQSKAMASIFEACSRPKQEKGKELEKTDLKLTELTDS
jgi:hypothetical protein